MNKRLLLYGGVAAVLAFVVLDDSAAPAGDLGLDTKALASLNTECMSKLLGLGSASLESKLKYCDCVVSQTREHWGKKESLEQLQKHKNVYAEYRKNPYSARRALASYEAARDAKLLVFLKVLRADRYFAELKEAEEELLGHINTSWKNARLTCLREDNAAGIKK